MAQAVHQGRGVRRKTKWEELLLLASARGGLFSAHEAHTIGLTRQGLQHHLRRGAIFRVARGIYRIPNMAVRPHESLVCAWLHFKDDATVSHGSALALHGLSVKPAVHQLTTAYTRWRRRRVPRDVELHFAPLTWRDLTYVDGLPVTLVLRTLVDCHHSSMDPERVDEACARAVERDLVDAGRLTSARAAPRWLRPPLPRAPPSGRSRRRHR